MTPDVSPARCALVFALDVPYPADYGGMRDTWAHIAHLARTGWTVDLVCHVSANASARLDTFLASTMRSQTVRNVWPVRRRPMSQTVSLLPYPLASRRPSATARDQLAGALRPFAYDVVLVEGVQCLAAYAALAADLRAARHLLRVQNIESRYYHLLAGQEPRLLRRLALYGTALQFRLFERRTAPWNAFDALLFISEEDLRSPLAARGRHAVCAPPLIVTPRRTGAPPGYHERQATVLYVANFDVADNLGTAAWLARSVAPQLQRVGARLVLAGRAHSALASVTAFGRDETVTVVPNPTDEALERLYETTRAFVALSRVPAGAKIKILDAAARHLPIVADATAAVGCPVRDALIVVADRDPEALFRAIEPLVTNANAWASRRDSVCRILARYRERSSELFEAALGIP